MRSRCCSGLLAALLLVIPMLGLAAWRSEGPFVAAIGDLAVDKTKPDSIYAATSAGGVWRSDDAGQTWTLPGDGMVSQYDEVCICCSGSSSSPEPMFSLV